MIFAEFGGILAIYTWHYIFAFEISIVAVIITLILTRINKNVMTKTDDISSPSTNAETSSYEPLLEEDENNEQMFTNLNDTDFGADQKRSLKKSSAVIAEMVIKANMSEEQKSLEQQVRQRQLTEIYRLMQQESDKFGDISLSEIEEQMKMYQ